MRTLLPGERNAMARARLRHDIICQIQDGDGNWQDYSKWLVSGNWGESKDSPVSTGALVLRRYGNYVGRVQVGGSYDRVIRLNMEQGAQNPGEIDYCEEPTELATDNGLEAGTGAGWSFGTNWAISNDGNARTGTWAAKHTAGVANTSATNPARIACVPGDVFYAEGWLKGVSTPDGSALVRIRWLDSGLSTLSVSSGNVVANDGVYHISTLIGTAPASAAFANIEFRLDTASTTGTWYGDDLVFRRYTAGTFRHPNGTVWTIPTNTRTVTSFEPGSGSGAKQFIMFVGSDGTRFSNIPFGSNVTGDGWRQFVACVYVNGQWSYDDNSVSRAFTPNSNDCIIARVTQDNTLGLATSFNGFINGQESGWAGGGSNFGGNIAPLNSTGILNVNAAGSYSPAIDKGRRVRLYGAVIPTDQVVDSFTRTNVTNSLGTTENAALTWLQNDNNLGINGNQAYCSAGGSGHSFGILQYTSDGVYQADVKLSSTAHRANVGLAVRELDVNNTLIISLCTGTGVNPVRLYKRDGGAFTSLVESTGPVLTPGSTYAVKVVLCGINIQIWINGVKQIDYDLTGADQTHFLTGVGGGLWINTGAGDGQDDLGSRWDNYLFTPSLGGEAGAAVKLGALYMGGCYREMFTGRIDTIDWSQDPMQLTMSDQGCWLQDTQIESEQQFGTTGGQAVETAMQNIINTWPSGMGTPSLYVPSSPSWNIRTYTQQRNKVMDACRDLALQIGWDARFRYDSAHLSRFTLMDPNRSNVTPIDSIGPTEYTDVRALSFNIAGVRNATLLRYVPAGGTAGATATASDSTSITKYGRRYIELPSSRNIDSSTEANKFVNAVINDLSDSGADQQIEMLYYWPVQLYDLLTFVANFVHYDQNQNWAVGSYEHRFANGFITTTIQVTGKVIGAYAVWQKRLTARAVDGIGNVDFGSTGVDNKDTDHVGQGNTYTTDAQNTGADNLAENGNFEATALDKDPVPGWTNNSATISLDTSAPYSGTKSLRVDNAVQFGAALSRKRFKVTVGDYYKVAGRMKCGSASDQADVQLMFFDGGGGYVGGVQAVTGVGQTTWSTTPQIAIGQVPANSAYAQISLQNNRAGAGTVYFDDVLIVRIRPFDDEVIDGAVYQKPPQYLGGDNVVENGNFEASASLGINGYPPGWQQYTGGTAPSFVGYETGSPYSGNRSLKITGTTGQGVMSLRRWKVRPGETWKISAVMKSGGGSTNAELDVGWRRADGSAVSFMSILTNSTSYNTQTATGVVPAGAVYADITMGASGATGDTYFDDLIFIRVRSLDDEVVDGSTYGKVVQTALTSNQPDMSKAGVLNKLAQYILRTGGGTDLQTIVQFLANTGHLNSSMQESGGKAVNRLLAKALAGDSDSLDGTPDGSTYRRLLNVASGLAQTASLADSAVTAPKVGAALGGGNLLQNASFEANVNDVWSLYNNGPESATWATITSGALHGSRFVRVSWTTANSSQKGVLQSNSAGFPGNVPFRTGVWFTISWYAKVGSALSCGMQNRWNHDPDVTVAVQNPNLSTTWQRYIFRVFWNNGSTPDVGIFISIATAQGGANVDLDIDAAQVEEGDVASGFKVKPDELYTTERTLVTTVLESGGKALARLLAKALAGDSDSLDGTPDGSTYKRMKSVLSAYGPVQMIYENTNITTVVTSDVSLASFSLPAGSLSTNGMSLRVTVAGTWGGVSDAFYVNFGATTVVQPVPVGPPSPFRCEILITRTGATAQRYNALRFSGASSSANQAAGTAAETMSGAITIDFRGQATSTHTLTIDHIIIEYLGV